MRIVCNRNLGTYIVYYNLLFRAVSMVITKVVILFYFLYKKDNLLVHNLFARLLSH